MFSTGFAVAHFTYPLNGATGVSQFLPFTWNQVAEATAYVLVVSPTNYGVPDFYWSAGSGLIPSITSQYVYALQPLTTYYAEICTEYPSPTVSRCTTSSFTTGAALPPPPNQAQFYQTIMNYTAQVKEMGQGFTEIPVSGSALYNQLLSYGGDPSQGAKCGNFATTLLNIFTQNNILSRQRQLSLNGPDGHVNTEFWDPFNNKCIVADPFFGVVYLNLTAQTGQSAEQIQQLLLSGQYSKVDSSFVTTYGSLYMTNYYFNPMLAYTNVVPFGTISSQANLNYVPNSPTQFMNEVDLSDVGINGTYFFNFANSTDSLTSRKQRYCDFDRSCKYGRMGAGDQSVWRMEHFVFGSRRHARLYNEIAPCSRGHGVGFDRTRGKRHGRAPEYPVELDFGSKCHQLHNMDWHHAQGKRRLFLFDCQEFESERGNQYFRNTLVGNDLLRNHLDLVSDRKYFNDIHIPDRGDVVSDRTCKRSHGFAPEHPIQLDGCPRGDQLHALDRHHSPCEGRAVLHHLTRAESRERHQHRCHPESGSNVLCEALDADVGGLHYLNFDLPDLGDVVSDRTCKRSHGFAPEHPVQLDGRSGSDQLHTLDRHHGGCEGRAVLQHWKYLQPNRHHQHQRQPESGRKVLRDALDADFGGLHYLDFDLPDVGDVVSDRASKRSHGIAAEHPLQLDRCPRGDQLHALGRHRAQGQGRTLLHNWKYLQPCRHHQYQRIASARHDLLRHGLDADFSGVHYLNFDLPDLGLSCVYLARQWRHQAGPRSSHQRKLDTDRHHLILRTNSREQRWIQRVLR